MKNCADFVLSPMEKQPRWCRAYCSSSAAWHFLQPSAFPRLDTGRWVDKWCWRLWFWSWNASRWPQHGGILWCGSRASYFSAILRALLNTSRRSHFPEIHCWDNQRSTAKAHGARLEPQPPEHRDHQDRLRDHLGRMQGWESVCWGVLGIPLFENESVTSI